MKKLLLSFLIVLVCVSSAYSALFGGIFGGNKSKSTQQNAKKSSRTKSLSVGLDGGWQSVGAIARYDVSDTFSAFGKFGWDYADFSLTIDPGRDPVILPFEISAAYFFPIVKDELRVGPSIGISLLFPKPFGVSPEIGAVLDWQAMVDVFSMFLRFYWQPAFYFNVDTTTSKLMFYPRFNISLGLTYYIL